MLIRKSKNKILAELKSNSRENLELIKSIEKLLFKQRGYVFKIPKPGSSVILLLSGGIDSVVMWDVLMFKFKLKVYPLFVTHKKGISRLLDSQYKSIKFFEKFYKEKYKNLFNSLYIMDGSKLIDKEIREATINNPEEIMKNIFFDGNINIQMYSTTTLLSCAGLDYSQLLQIRHKVPVDSIFTGNLSIDGTVIQSQTLTSMRSNMLNICNISGDYRKQFTSLFLEKELGFFFDKDFVIQWAKSKGIPLKKSWTCWHRNFLLPCGVCTTCKYRRHIMIENNMEDSLYVSDIKARLLTIKDKVSKLLMKGKQ